MQIILPILSILTGLLALVSFGIKAFTGRSAEDEIYRWIHRPLTPQSQSPPQAHIVDMPLPTGSAGTSPLQPPPVLGTPPVQQNFTGVATQPPPIPRRSLRRVIPHPWLFGMSLLGLFLTIVPFAHPESATAGFAFLMGLGIMILVMISGAVIAARGKHWVWFTVIILTIGYGTIFFSIFARPKKQILASSMGTAGSPMEINGDLGPLGL